MIFGIRQIEKAARYAMARPEISAVVIGFKSVSEIDEAIRASIARWLWRKWFVSEMMSGLRGRKTRDPTPTHKRLPWSRW